VTIRTLDRVRRVVIRRVDLRHRVVHR
jgi:hypothetical protein